jgi:hypothetical protein
MGTAARYLTERLRPNSSKPNQTQTKPDQENGLGFSWILSSDSWLFNGLRAIQIKKMQLPRSSPGARRPASIRPIAWGNGHVGTKPVGDARPPHRPRWELRATRIGLSAADRRQQAAGLRATRPAGRHFRARIEAFQSLAAPFPGESHRTVHRGSRLDRPASRLPRLAWPRGDPRRLMASEFCQ